jgi:amidase
MARHVVETAQTGFDASIPAVLEVDAGDIVTFRTSAVAYERLAAGESLADIGIEKVNLVFGPVAVRGAVPGDAVGIEILDIEIASAWSVWVPGLGPLGNRTERMRAERIEIEDGRLVLGDGIATPLAPMIGCVAVAPRGGRASTFAPAFPFGGNMDLRELSPGATLLLPVQVNGGLLSLGDLHAAMGHGEPTSVAIEAAGAATVRIWIEKDAGLRAPRLRVGGATICIGIADTYPEARADAIAQAFELLTTELEPFDAYRFMSARVDVRLGGPASPIVLAVVPDR